MKFDKNRPSELRVLLRKAIKDPLRLFVLGNAQEEMEQIQKSNLNFFLDEANRLGFKYVYFGKGDLAGCENLTDSNGTWPLIWKLAEILDLRHSCGNKDQHQITGWCNDNQDFCDGHDYIGVENVGGWNIVQRRKLTLDEQFQLPFYYVVDREIVRKAYYEYKETLPISGRHSYPWPRNLG